MGTVIPFLGHDAAFDPQDIEAMSLALDDVCKALNVSIDATVAREIIATRIVELARRGERNALRLSDRVYREAVGLAGDDYPAGHIGQRHPPGFVRTPV